MPGARTILAASIGDDDAAADAAWRATAPDIAGRDPGRSPAQGADDGAAEEQR